MLFKKKISSEIILEEKQANNRRKGSFHFPVYVRTKEKHVYALFTENEINKAITRAEKNPEAKLYEPREYWLSRLLKFVLW